MATHIQSRGASTTNEDNSLAFSSPITAGSLLVVSVRESSGTDSAVLSDTLGNTYVKVQRSGGRTSIWCAVSASGGANTVSWDTTSSGTARVIISEFGGDWPADPRELTTTVTIGTSSPQNTNSLTRTASTSGVFYAILDTNGDTSAVSVGSPFNYGTGCGSRLFCGYALSSGAESRSCTFTMTLSNGNTNSAGVVSFAENPSGGSPSPAVLAFFLR